MTKTKRPMVEISNRQRKISINIPRIKKDCQTVLELLGHPDSELSLLFASAQKTRELNRTYRGKDQTTDVLSYPAYDSPRDFPKDRTIMLGDVLINPSRALEQSKEYGVTLKQEIRRLLVHGILHLVGYDHERNAYQQRKMSKKEQELLDLLDK